MSEKSEEILEKVMDLLRELEQVSAEAPIPIVQDRRKGLAESFALKAWLQKLEEEVDELKYELYGFYALEDVPSQQGKLPLKKKWLIIGEMCDVIEVLYSMAQQMGIDGKSMQIGIHRNNEKLKERGCFEGGAEGGRGR